MPPDVSSESTMIPGGAFPPGGIAPASTRSGANILSAKNVST
jgi:hypothetical protein